MSKAVVQQLVDRLMPLVDRELYRTMFDFTLEIYKEADGWATFNFSRACAWWVPRFSAIAGPKYPFDELPEWDDLEEWRHVAHWLGDFPVARTVAYFGSLGEIGWTAARELGIEKWFDLACDDPGAPVIDFFNPLGWSDPLNARWVRESLGIVYCEGSVDYLGMTPEEARGCYLWMVVVLEVMREAWRRLEDLGGDIAYSLGYDEFFDGLDEETPDRGSARFVVKTCEEVIAGLEAGQWPGMRLALPWFEEFAGEMTLSAVLLPELDLPPDSTSVKVQIEGGPRARIYDRRGQCLIEEVDLARFLPSLEPEFRIAWQRLIPSHGERFEAWIDGELEVPRTGYALAWRVVYGSRLPYAPL